MRNVALILLLAAISLLILSCEDMLSRKTWAYFNETGCHNPWGIVEKDQVEPAVVSFLDEKGIPVFDIRTEIYSEGPFCMACTCPTGRRVHVLIRESDSKEIQRLGFEF